MDRSLNVDGLAESLVQAANNPASMESQVIGSLLIDIDYLDEVCGILTESDFLAERYRTPFHVMVEMRKRGDVQIDVLTVADEAARFDSPEFQDGIETQSFRESQKLWIGLLGEMLTSVVATASVIEYAKLIKEKSLKRHIEYLLTDASKKNFKTSEDKMDFIRHGFDKIEDDAPTHIKNYTSVLNETYDAIDQAYNKKTTLTGVSTGFKHLDEMTNGLQKGDLIVLGARPSMGKTMLALNIADHIGLHEKLPVLFFSLEMSEDQLCKRTLSRFAEVPAGRIFSGNLTEDDWLRINTIIPFLNNSKMIINDKGSIDTANIRAFARQVKRTHGLSAIFVDYIGLIKGDGENDTAKIGNISRDLKILAKDLKIPVFCLVQLNRNLESREDKRPVLSDIRSSGSIEQDADIIIFLHRHTKDSVFADIEIAKHRNGKIGRFTLEVKNDILQFKDAG